MNECSTMGLLSFSCERLVAAWLLGGCGEESGTCERVEEKARTSRFGWLEFREAVLLFLAAVFVWSVEGHPSRLFLPPFGPLSTIFFGLVWIFVPGAGRGLFAKHRDLCHAVAQQAFVYA